jgi:hypothetical protein
MIIEVGMGKKDKKQIIKTASRISSDYNVIFSSSELGLDAEQETISVPLEYFFMI